MRTVGINQARKVLSKLIEDVCKGQEVVITRWSKPVVRFERVTEISRERKPGALKGKLHLGPEFFEPLPTNELF